MMNELEWQQWRQQGAGHAAAAAFLLLDVQTNLAMLDILQARLDKLRADPDAEPYALSGNSYFVQLGPRQVLIEALYGDDIEPVTLDLDDFRDALGYWRVRIEADGDFE
ncbi:MAG: hypothetical protein ACFCUJ_15550 [Thiotrichales bacterium]